MELGKLLLRPWLELVVNNQLKQLSELEEFTLLKLSNTFFLKILFMKTQILLNRILEKRNYKILHNM